MLFTCVSLQGLAQQCRRYYLLAGALQENCVCNKDLAHSIQTPLKKNHPKTGQKQLGRHIKLPVGTNLVLYFINYQNTSIDF